MAVTSGSDLPPAYYKLVADENSEEKKAAEVRRSNSEDLPKDEEFADLFKDKVSRIAFIQKVLVIKLFQTLAVTIILAVFAAGPYELYMLRRWHWTATTVTSVVTLVGTLVLIHWCDEARFKRPFNYFFLFMYPVSVAFFISVISFQGILGEILTSWISSIIVVFALLMYSIAVLGTEKEFKTSIGMFIAAGCLIVWYGLAVGYNWYFWLDTFFILYGCLAVFALTWYMLYEIRAMTLRDYRLPLAPSDCVKAALMMHVDYRYIIMNWLRKNDGTQDTGRV